MVIAIGLWFLAPLVGPADVEAVPVVAIAGTSWSEESLLEASGYIVARRQATVSSKISGKVLDLYIEEGQRVDAGQILARLDASNLSAALEQSRAQVAVAQASAQEAQLELEHAVPRDRRLRELHAKGFLSDQAVDDSRNSAETAQAALVVAQRQVTSARAALEVAQRSLDDMVIRAPFAGVVTVKAAQPGEIVSPISGAGGFTRTGIGTIVDMDSLEVEVDVSESFIGRVKTGMQARVTLTAYPEAAIPAEVIAVVPTADRSKATVLVRVGLKARDPRIVPDMGARVAFLSPPATLTAVPTTRSFLIPRAAVTVESGQNGHVFVISGARVERRAVRLGGGRGEDQVILAGVASGERLAISRKKPLTDGAKIRIQPSSPRAGNG
ncbi:efflux RND transporter periplasmic adaptor subunit [Phenylobacterium sp.]|jgi:RND family efflux transporter MFP subunit|uniref:efflux RND transporter periplasmic adaptor subunit n=1 Tax=Phenylobacterium sp. TaxID=1871053 RepID=UPI0037C7A094